MATGLGLISKVTPSQLGQDPVHVLPVEEGVHDTASPLAKEFIRELKIWEALLEQFQRHPCSLSSCSSLPLHQEVLGHSCWSGALGWKVQSQPNPVTRHEFDITMLLIMHPLHQCLRL
jgi:hypothetical protein